MKMGFVSSPRPWGCFQCEVARAANDLVFPTPVGVFLGLCAAVCALLRLPHARGGVSSGRHRLNIT